MLERKRGGWVACLGGAMLLTMIGCGSPADGTSNTFVQENDLFVFSRTIPSSAAQNTPFGVWIVVEAKRDLALLAVSESLPEAFVVSQGVTTGFLLDVAAGEKLELHYELQGRQRGEFSMGGVARGKPIEGESVQLELSSPLAVR